MKAIPAAAQAVKEEHIGEVVYHFWLQMAQPQGQAQEHWMPSIVLI